MKFMMFVVTDSEPDAVREASGEIERWLEETETQRVTGDRLRPPREAKTVRVRNGQTLIIDGPFAETKDVIVGFDILECDSIEEAVAIAAKHPMARAGRLEVRPFWPFD
jgi:hypothetical protein